MNKQIQTVWLASVGSDPNIDLSGVQTIVTTPEEIELFARAIVRQSALVAGLMEAEGREGIGAQIMDSWGIPL